jgi:hypothetical protein
METFTTQNGHVPGLALLWGLPLGANAAICRRNCPASLLTPGGRGLPSSGGGILVGAEAHAKAVASNETTNHRPTASDAAE